MTKNIINHIWFDFSDTIAFIGGDAHDKLRYKTYSEIVGRPVDENLIEEYKKLYEENHRSNSAVFHCLGKPAGFWSEQISFIDPLEIYRLAEPSIPRILGKIRQVVPVSIFSNIELSHVLPALGIKISMFTNIISSGMFKRPKPALDGFYKLIELSELPPNKILYIGDSIGKDVRPAKQLGILTGLMWDKSDEADYCFSKFEDILRILDVD